MSQGEIQAAGHFVVVFASEGTGETGETDDAHGDAEDARWQVDEVLAVVQGADGSRAEDHGQGLVDEIVHLGDAGAKESRGDAAAEGVDVGIAPVQAEMEDEALTAAG